MVVQIIKRVHLAVQKYNITGVKTAYLIFITTATTHVRNILKVQLKKKIVNVSKVKNTSTSVPYDDTTEKLKRGFYFSRHFDGQDV